MRKAEIKDYVEGAELIYMTAPYFYRYLFASDEKRVKKVLELLFTKPNNLFSYQNAWILEENDKIVGLALAISSSMKKYLRKSIIYYKEIIKINGFIKFIKMFMCRRKLKKIFTPLSDDEFYIISLAVIPEYRNKGYGKRLLKIVEREAKKQGFSKISVDVELTNFHAHNMYLKMGYKDICELKDRKNEKKSGIIGFVKMRKDLNVT